MEETGKAGKKSNIEINADKGAKQNSHPGREEWPHLIRIGVMVFVTFAVSILFFFALYRFEGFAGIWSKLLAAAMPIIMGLVLAYLMNPVMLWLERCFKKLLSQKDEKRKQAAKGFKSSCNHRLGYYSCSNYFAPHCGYCAFCHSKYIGTYEDTAK